MKQKNNGTMRPTNQKANKNKNNNEKNKKFKEEEQQNKITMR